MNRTADIGTGVVVAAAGAFFFWGAGQIEIYGGDEIQADFFPRAVSALIFVAGTALVAINFLGPSAPAVKEGAVADWSDFFRVTLPLAFLTLCYILAWRALGYVVATLLIAPPMFFVFGNRGLKWAFLFPLAIAIIFFLTFFSVMGLYDAPGRIFDQGPINRLLGS